MNKKWLAPLLLVVAALLSLVLRPAPKLARDMADGVYANECCGTLTLRNGAMSFHQHELAYIIETDKGGAYIMPKTYVGVEPPYGLQIDRTKNPLKMRLDDEKHPQAISIFGRDRSYEFTR
jgi:hypothetical protein